MSEVSKKAKRSKLYTHCVFCGEPLPKEKHPRQKFCSKSHADKHNHRVKAARRKGGKASALSPLYKRVAELMGEELIVAEELRPVINDILRENITQHVKDSALGTFEILANLMPKALAALNQDLESRDPLERTRAAMFLSKLFLSMKDIEPGPRQSPPTLEIITNVNVPQGPAGEVFLEETINPKHLMVDDTVQMGECYKCHEWKPTEALNKHDMMGDKQRWICQGCYAKKKNRQGGGGVTAGLLDAGDILRDSFNKDPMAV